MLTACTRQPGVWGHSFAPVWLSSHSPPPATTKCLPEGTQVVRVMPNTPCLVGALAAGMSPNAATLPENKEMILKLLQSLGVAMEVKVWCGWRYFLSGP